MIDNYQMLSFTFDTANAPPKSRKRGVDRDLTEEEIEREMKRMREELSRNPNHDFRQR
jgi:hypothetical protein